MVQQKELEIHDDDAVSHTEVDERCRKTEMMLPPQMWKLDVGLAAPKHEKMNKYKEVMH